MVGPVVTGGRVVVDGLVITGGQVGTGGQDGLVVADVDNPKYPKLACRLFFTKENIYNKKEMITVKNLSNFYYLSMHDLWI